MSEDKPVAIPCDIISVNSEDAFDIRDFPTRMFRLNMNGFFSTGKNYSTESSKELDDEMHFFIAREEMMVVCFEGHAWFFLDKCEEVCHEILANIISKMKNI